MKSNRQYSLLADNSFAVEAITPIIYYPDSLQDLAQVSAQLEAPFYVLGEGSNTLFVEDKAPVIIKPEFRGIEIHETSQHYCITAACAENWHQLVLFTLEQGINGLENLALIPGSVGAAPVQNIGAYGVELADFVEQVSWYEFESNEVHTFTKAQCQFGYRNSVFKQRLKGKGLITELTLRINKQWQPKLNYQGLDSLAQPCSAKDVLKQVIALRTAKLPDPKKCPNAGSFFKNPLISHSDFLSLKKNYPNLPHYPQENGQIKLAAGWLIEQAGLKGYQMSQVAVHDKQALVLVNKGTQCGSEIKLLAEYVRAKVFELFLITLEPEVRMITTNGEINLSKVN